MPRYLHSVPKYRKHRASGQALVTLCGRDFYLGPHGTRASRTEYDRLIAQWLASGRQPFWKRSEELTVCEVAARYWTYAKQIHVKDGRPTPELTHVKVTLRSLLKLFRDTPVEEFGPLALRVVQDSLVAEGLARSTVNARVARIKQMFKWAVAEELVPVKVHQALTTVAGLRRGRTTARV